MNSISLRRVAIVLIVVTASGVGVFSWLHSSAPPLLEAVAEGANKSSKSADDPHIPDKKAQDVSTSKSLVKVDVIKPRVGGIDRTCVVPGSIHAFESADLFAKVPGYLDKLNVDIGDRVTEGQLLAEIYAPELFTDVDRRKADVEKAVAQVKVMQANVAVAKANHHAAETGVTRARSAVKRDKAAYEFREKQYIRFKELVRERSVDERLVDEKMEQQLAAAAAVDASEAGVDEADAQVTSAAAQIEKANADLADAEAEVVVAQANLERANVFASYTKIKSPYTGVISLRTYHRGAFIRGADQTSVQPMLTVEKTDVVRLVIYVPDSDVPLTHVGADTETTIETLPGHVFKGKVSRLAVSEDQKTKTMRTEVDLQNDRGLLRNGMFGRTKLILHVANPNAFTIPSSSLVGATKDNKGNVFVVRDGTAHKTTVTVSVDNGVSAEIADGITASDMVVAGNNNSIADGLRVEAHEIPMPDSSKK